MERKRGGDGERQQTSRSTTTTIQQQDGKDKRKAGWRETGGGGLIKWSKEDKSRWREGSREGEILGGGGVVGRKVGKKEEMGKERKKERKKEKKEVLLSIPSVKKNSSSSHAWGLFDELPPHCLVLHWEWEPLEGKERRERGRGSKSSCRVDRWYNLEKERGREAYEFKNWWRRNEPG